MRAGTDKTRNRWTAEDISSFCMLTSEASLAEAHSGLRFVGALPAPSVFGLPPDLLAPGGLLEFAKDSEDRRSARIQDLRARVAAHRVHGLLTHDSAFQSAMKLFQKKSKQKNAGRYAEEFADLRFLHIVALIVGNQALYPKPTLRSATRPTAIRARKAVVTLLATMDEGIRLPEWTATNSLRTLLVEMKSHLDKGQLSTGKRKPRSDAGTSRRYYIDNLIELLVEAFGEVSPKIVLTICEMMGFEPDPSTIERRINQTRS